MENQSKKIFVGVAWPYVNGNIHFGHLAGYLIPADIFARFHRFIGNEVMMVSGSDCFGTPVTVEADKRQTDPKTIVEEYHPQHDALFKKLNLSFDLYTKTDNPVHKEIVQDLFITLLEKGLLYRDRSGQYYSETENRFLPDRYVEGTCPFCADTEARSDQCDNCGRVLAQGELINPISKLNKAPVSMKETEHYFFDWPKLESFLKTYVAKYGPDWRPWIFNESTRWLEGGLKPRAITRDLDWGVEIPADRIPADQLIAGYEHKRIYVWFEAVIGYLSASIKLSRDSNKPDYWHEFWHNPEAGHYYFMGKDNLVFHTIFWPGQLHTYDEKLHLPDVLAVNQFLTLNNEAFSKSFGVTLDPNKILEDFDLDIIRLYLCLIMPENHDSDFTWDDFIAKTNNLIIANLGNFLFRTLKLSENLSFTTSTPDETVVAEVNKSLSEAKELLANCNFKRYAERIMDLSAFANKYLSDTAPWIVKKTDETAYISIMHGALLISLALTAMMTPITPSTAKKLADMHSIELLEWPSIETIQELVKTIIVKDPTPLFKKIEADPSDFNERYK
jgi:methionyl-tRNA synthetase